MPRLSLVYLALLLGAGAIYPSRSLAQQPEHFNRKQLHQLMEQAADADEYQKLASYFRYRELAFRAKAQNTLDGYISLQGGSATSTKFISRAEIADRLRQHYLCKADENAKFAHCYFAKLSQLGVKPLLESATMVSLKSLQQR
jgi:hypothetical protein